MIIDSITSQEYAELQRIINDGSCVAFVGSGLSSGVYPNWEELINSLCERCGVERIGTEQSISVDILLEKADEAKEKNELAYNAALRESFAPKVFKREAYELLMRLRFKFYITVNLDPLLANETARPEYGCRGFYYYPDLPYETERAVYYIHGKVNEGENFEVILGKKDFSRGYSPNRTLYNFLYRVLMFDRILFVGCGLREPPLREIFKICHEMRKEIELLRNRKAPARYILLPFRYLKIESHQELQRDIEGEELENSSFRDLGILPARYEPKDREHSGLEQLFREWCKLPMPNILSGF